MSDRQIADFVKAQVAIAPKLLKELYTDQQLFEQYSTDLAEDIERLNNDKLAKLFAKYAPIEGAKSADYQTRIVSIDGAKVLCGIRFRGMDITQSFVNIAAMTAPLTPDHITAISRQLAIAFKIFQPLYCQLFIPSHLPFSPSDFTKAHWDYRLLASPLTTLIDGADQALDHSMSPILYAAQTLDFYSDYESAYIELFEESPEHRLFTGLQSIEDMQDNIDQGLVYLLKVKDKLAGIMALDRDNSLGITGFYVNENIVFNGYRGMGLGKWLQRAVIGRLAQRPDTQSTDMLFGTIQFDNTAAIECAKSVGRQDIGGYLWVGI